MIIYDYHFYSSLKIDLEFYRFTAAHPDQMRQMGTDGNRQAAYLWRADPVS